MRLMRAWTTRGTAVVLGVTSRPVRACLRTAAGRLHPAAGAGRLVKRWRFGGLAPGGRTAYGYCRPIVPGTPRLGAVA
jgi:hypothetical protein